MAPRNPQLIGVGIAGRAQAVTAQRRLNCYLDIQEEGDRAIVVAYGCSGLTELVNLGTGPIRGMESPPDHAYMYVAHGTTMYKIANDGGATAVGTLGTAVGVVYFATGHLNGSNERHMMVVDGSAGYYVDVSAASPSLTTISDGDFPSNPQSCAYSNGYFITHPGDATGTVFSSQNADDASAWDAADFASAESKGDTLQRVFVHQGVLAMMGSESIEYWTYDASTGFPFAANLGLRHDWGVAANASVVGFGDFGIALMQSSLGEAVVQLLHPSGPQTVTPPDLAALWNGYTVISDAIGCAFMEAGHPMYLLNFPTEGKTWQFDGRSRAWSERQTGADGEAYCAAHSGALVGKMRFGGRATGAIYTLDSTSYTDAGVVMVCLAVTEHVHQAGNAMMRAGELWVDCEVGTGPTLMTLDDAYSLKFDGVNDYMQADGTTVASFTVEVWVRPHTLRIQGIMYGADGSVTARIFMADGAVIEFDATGEIANAEGPTGLVANAWAHIAAVYDSAAQTAVVYIDGVAGVIKTGIASMGTLATWVQTAGTGDNIFDGDMTEFRLWNVARTQAEILEAKGRRLTGSETGLVGYWPFDEGSGTTAKDLTAPKNDGVITGATYTTSVPFGRIAQTPQMMLRVSRDKGQSWGPEHWATMGALGKYGTRTRWRRLGRGNDLTFEISRSDPVPFTVTGAWLRVQAAKGSGRVNAGAAGGGAGRGRGTA